MGCAKQHVTVPASNQEVQFAQLLRRSGPNIPRAAVTNQGRKGGCVAVHVATLTSGLAETADLTSREGGKGTVQWWKWTVDRLMKDQTEGATWGRLLNPPAG